MADLTSEGNIWRLSNEHGISVIAGTTKNYTVKAVLSNSTELTTSLTLEIVDIPEPTLYTLDGRAAQNTSNYYELTTLSDRKPIFTWSTAEVADTILPSGFSWAYAIAINVYGTQMGASTLEVGDQISLSPDERATMEYSSGTDLASLFTNASFISPVDFFDEVHGEKACYHFYLQRVLLNAEGRYNGIAAGLFRNLRYLP